MSFDQLGLIPELLDAITEKGYKTPSPIQAQAIPVVLDGGDVMGGAQTGTGKTAAFTLPILQILSKRPRKGTRPRALVLTPTRELAAQVEDSVKDYGVNLNLKSTVVFGGVGINPQISRLKKGVDILVATPGRLLDHVGQKTVSLDDIEILILDEADRMLDMGFIHDIRKVLRVLPPKRQNLMFSATYAPEIKALADGILTNPTLIEVAARNTAAETVSQLAYDVPRSHKRKVLSHLIKEGDWHQVLVFTRTKHGANKLTKQLIGDGISAAAIHGNKSQTARTRALAEFKSNDIQVLVATDVAARGIDVDLLPHVVNFDLPEVPETYVHRIGRTGRAGSEGQAISFVCMHERNLMRAIERLLGRAIEMAFLPDLDLTPTDADKIPPPPPGSRGRGGGGGQRRGQRQGGGGGGGRRGGPPGSSGGRRGGGQGGGGRRGAGPGGNNQRSGRGSQRGR